MPYIQDTSYKFMVQCEPHRAGLYMVTLVSMVLLHQGVDNREGWIDGNKGGNNSLNLYIVSLGGVLAGNIAGGGQVKEKS